MKTLMVIISIVLACTITSVGQNYMGMSQSKILKSMGEPDVKGESFFIYTDYLENGENIYYFDENNNCTSYTIVRNNEYLKDYQKLLKKEFKQSSENKFWKKTRKTNYSAEITKSKDKFQIRIQQVKSTSDTSDKTASKES